MATETEEPRKTMSQYTNVPVPDPSVVTQQIIDKAKNELRRESLERTAASDRAMTIRLDSMDRASIVLSDNVTRVPTLLDREVARVVEMLKRSEELVDVKFKSATTERSLLRSAIEQQFSERDVRSDQDKSAASTAINAALSALKEMIALQNTANAAAITKSEASTVKQIDGILALFSSDRSSLNDKIAVINGRLDRGEGGDKAHSSSQATMIAVAGVVAMFLGVAVGYIAHSSTAPPLAPVQPAAVAVVPLK